MTVGRPSKYNEDIQFQADAYVSGEYRADNDVIPTLSGLALAIGVCTSTLDNWGVENTEFLGTLIDLKAQQERALLNKGLIGEFNATISKLMLTNHGYSDKVREEVSGPDGGAQEHEWTVRVIEVAQ